MATAQRFAPDEVCAQPNTSKLKAGVTAQKEAWGVVHVANAQGEARSHIHLTAEWDVPPEVPFAIFTYPNNSALFRDVRHVGQRRVVTVKPGYKLVEVQQLQEIKVLWVHRTFSTWLKVEEDGRDADLMDIKFDLMTSDVLSQFKGHWIIRSVKDPQGNVIGCTAELHQDVLPRGVPEHMRNIPVLGNIVRGIAMRAIRRVMEDMHKAIAKIKVELAKGHTVMDVLRDMCGPCDEMGHANGGVKAFAMDDVQEEEDEEEEEEGKEEGEGTLPTQSVHVDVDKQQQQQQAPVHPEGAEVPGVASAGGVEGVDDAVASAVATGLSLAEQSSSPSPGLGLGLGLEQAPEPVPGPEPIKVQA